MPRTVKVPRPPKASEKDTQKAILQYLALRKIFHWRNNIGSFGGEYKGKKRFHRFGLAGSSDIICIHSVAGIGVFVGFEVKAEGEKQNENQLLFEQDVTKAAGFYFVVRSLNDVVRALEYVESEVLRRIRDYREV